MVALRSDGRFSSRLLSPLQHPIQESRHPLLHRGIPEAAVPAAFDNVELGIDAGLPQCGEEDFALLQGHHRIGVTVDDEDWGVVS